MSAMERASKARQKLVVIGVRTDPHPDHSVGIPGCDSTPVQADTHRKDGAGRMHLLEFQRSMRWIGEPKRVSSSGLSLNTFGKCVEASPEPLRRYGFHLPRRSKSKGVVRPALKSARASSASFSSTFWVSANFFAQRASSAISSRMIAPSASCSSGGNLRACSMAFSKIVVMTNNIPQMRAYFERDTPLPNPPPQGRRGSECIISHA